MLGSQHLIENHFVPSCVRAAKAWMDDLRNVLAREPKVGQLRRPPPKPDLTR